MTPCSICRRNPAATAQGLCQQCAASATAIGTPGPVPGPGPVPPPAPGYGYPAAPGPAAPGYPQYPAPAPAAGPSVPPYGGAPYGAPMPFAPMAPQVKAPVGLSYAVIALLCVTAVVDLLGVGAGLNAASLAKDLETSPFAVTQDEADDADALMALAIVFKYLAVLATGILFIIWFAAARANAAAFAPYIDKWGKGFAIGGWFIPAANIAIPRLVAGTIWIASRPDPYAPKSVQRRTLLTVWWTLCVAAYLPWSVGFLSYDGSETAKDLRIWSNTFALGSILSIAAAIVAIFVVRRITRMQTEKIAMGWQPAMPPMPTAY
ncbi:DUF4328 domain-containing protein [Streptomyces sp. NPDC006798]|uniref:DUF4328 domain-containing protein n=1 Tax=Streptomyces sp. NPDC006798 TaxID=3155462 RepID=UPI0033F0EEA0